MPCSDGDWYEREGVAEMKKRLAGLTDLLCKAGRAFYSGEKPPPDVMAWWKIHKKADSYRGEPWEDKDESG